jgi:hypothetical protein
MIARKRSYSPRRGAKKKCAAMASSSWSIRRGRATNMYRPPQQMLRYHCNNALRVSISGPRFALQPSANDLVSHDLVELHQEFHGLFCPARCETRSIPRVIRIYRFSSQPGNNPKKPIRLRISMGKSFSVSAFLLMYSCRLTDWPSSRSAE